MTSRVTGKAARRVPGVIPHPTIAGREYVKYEEIWLDCGRTLPEALVSYNDAGPEDDDRKAIPSGWTCPPDCRTGCTFSGRSDHASAAQAAPFPWGWALAGLLALGALCVALGRCA